MDPIANMLTMILNAQRVKKDRVAVPYSRFKLKLAELLRDKGYVAHVSVREGMPQTIMITLKYPEGKGRIEHVRRFSSPGQRRYVTRDEIPYSADGYGMVIVSTPQGVMDDTRARKEGLGGELVCEIW